MVSKIPRLLSIMYSHWSLVLYLFRFEMFRLEVSFCIYYWLYFVFIVRLCNYIDPGGTVSFHCVLVCH